MKPIFFRASFAGRHTKTAINKTKIDKTDFERFLLYSIKGKRVTNMNI